MTPSALARLWRDESGAILSAELVIILTIVVLGMITGLACLQQSIVAELQDLSAAFAGLNQSYFTSSFRGCLKVWGRTSATAGSMFIDRRAGGANFGFAEIGVGSGAVTYGAAPRTLVAPSETCVTCPPATDAVITPQAVPCPDTTVPCPTSACPTAPQVGEPVIPQGPAPQLSPQTW